jgi:uncharacterized protein
MNMAYSMVSHLTLLPDPVTSQLTVKVDVLGVQDLSAVDAEGNTVLLLGTGLGSALVLDPDLGFSGVEHRVVGVTFLVLDLYH